MGVVETRICHPPVFQYDMALGFLDWWFEGTPEGQLFHLRMIRDKPPGKAASFFFKSVKELVDQASKAQAPWGTFFGCCPRNGEDASKAGVQWLPGYWCDVDCGDDEEARLSVEAKIAKLPIKPSQIVGTPGGFHLWFRFREMEEILPFGEDVAKHEAKMEHIAAVVGGDVACKDLSRVMRLPGSIHYKGEPRGVISL
jgi:hypothetical protein